MQRVNPPSQATQPSRFTGILLSGLFWFAAVNGLAARESVPSEYSVKAAFLLNFGKFVTWPENDFPSNSAPLVIGVVGGNPFHEDLRKMIDGKSIGGRPLVFRLFPTPEAVRNCHILFVSQSAQRDAPAILAALRGADVLTVTENLPHFANSGFTVNFVTVQEHIRFQINQPATARTGLTISSKLLSLALPPDH
jgi:hypothetical protein